MRDIAKILEQWKNLPQDGKVKETEDIKFLASSDYNFIFDKNSGKFARWGKTEGDDPQWSPFGPEIADIELSSGECSSRCAFCYKGNGDHSGKANNMSLETFKRLFSKLPKTVNQIAFGICDITTNEDFFPIMEYTRANGVIPNYTCNGHFVTEEVAKQTAACCGAVAVSVVDKELSYNAVKKFTDAGMRQVNFHSLLSEETFDKCMSIVDDMSTDPRLKKMRAIVFLQYKHKNPSSPFHSMLDKKKYQQLVEHCLKKKINFGFDSCSANLFMESMSASPNLKRYAQVSEPCESVCFSSYINWEGKFFPCSFCENVKDWTDGIDVVNCNDFIKDIWMHPRVQEFREKLLNNNRNCPIYNI